MISRREVLSWLGVSAGACAVGAGNAVSAGAVEPRPMNSSKIVSLESFTLTSAAHSQRVQAYLSETLLPRMAEMHKGPRLCLEAIVAPHTPQAALLAVFSSFEEMLDVRARLAANPGIRQVRAELESAGALEGVQTQVLVVGKESLHFPAERNSFKTGLLEVRSYDAPAWQDGPPESVNQVFRRAGIQAIVSGATAAGEHLPRFLFVIPFESLEAREKIWDKLETDAEWISMQGDWASKHGYPVRATGKSIYKLVPSYVLG